MLRDARKRPVLVSSRAGRRAGGCLVQYGASSVTAMVA
jgi:hypothetical protein